MRARNVSQAVDKLRHNGKPIRDTTMRAILQVEYREGLLSIREELLQSLGRRVISVFGSKAARKLEISDHEIAVISIGHGAPWAERSELIVHFKKISPPIPVIACLRQSDEPFAHADYNCPADNPPEWVRTVNQALVGIQ